MPVEIVPRSSGSASHKSAKTGRAAQGTRMPPDVMAIVLDFVDSKQTALNVMRTCRAYYEIAVPHVYRSITLDTIRQLLALVETSQLAVHDCGHFHVLLPPHACSAMTHDLVAFVAPLARDHVNLSARLAQQFHHTRSLRYRINEGVFRGQDVRRYRSLRRRPDWNTIVYLALRDIEFRDAQSELIFPNLKTTEVYAVPKLDSFSHLESTFLSRVTKITLLHNPLSEYDSSIHFEALAMSDIHEIRLRHLLGVEVSGKSDLIRYVGAQTKLSSFQLELGEHFEHTLGLGGSAAENASLHINGGTQVMPSVRRARNIETLMYISEYASAVAMVVTGVAYGRQLARSQSYALYPALARITIDIGSEADIHKSLHAAPGHNEAEGRLSDRQLLSERIRKDIIKWRQYHRERAARAAHDAAAQAQSARGLPPVELRLGPQGEAWMLGDPEMTQQTPQIENDEAGSLPVWYRTNNAGRARA